MEVKKQISILLCVLLLTLSTGCYKDFDFKKKLSKDIYLAQSNILPSKYICIAKDEHHLIIVDEVVSLYGNKENIVVETLEYESNHKFYKINFSIVEYPEDIVEIGHEAFQQFRKDTPISYRYTETEGFVELK